MNRITYEVMGEFSLHSLEWIGLGYSNIRLALRSIMDDLKSDPGFFSHSLRKTETSSRSSIWAKSPMQSGFDF